MNTEHDAEVIDLTAEAAEADVLAIREQVAREDGRVRDVNRAAVLAERARQLAASDA